MTGAAAVVQNDMTMNSSNGRIEMEIGVKALGVLGTSNSLHLSLLKLTHQPGLYISTLNSPSFSIKTNLLMTILGQIIPEHAVTIGNEAVGGSNEAGVLKIDLEKAWEELGLDGKEGWGNSLFLKVFLTPVA